MIARSLANFMSGVVIATMPAYATSFTTSGLPAILRGAGTYGLLMSSYTVGNIVGAAIAGKFQDKPLGKTIMFGLILSLVCWIIAISASSLLVTVVFIALTFTPSSIIGIQIAATIQAVPPERFVGRISSLNGSATHALIPIGSIAGGTIASKFSPKIAMYSYVLGPAIYVLFVVLRSDLRQLPRPDEISGTPPRSKHSDGRITSSYRRRT
ncbi:hypothetical protein BRC81_14540 [Halobacteriales archaeon QS_1_68_20]|nr:MAG: hypothetical protein BRC81_14540 [Halobacteriales archaeon QS_1_68_20]